MVGTVEGGKRAALTNLRKYGNEFYRDIGRKGGINCHAGGFAANTELARKVGKSGGRKTGCGPVKKMAVE